ncbi:hypothetical protein OAQ99_03985 [Candidatus Kapabacteria bacterium]|nr:hypothetical protein [Candidatus Kapabacteria bacterium]
MHKLISLIIICSFSVFASEKFQPKVLIGTSYNLHNANFKQLPDVQNCCDQFDGGSGLGFEFGVGFDYVFDQKLFGLADYYSFGLIYKDFSGLLEKEVVSGNIIREFSFEPAYSKISLDASISYLLTSHYFNFNLSEKLKTDFFISLDIGFAISGKYSQREDAVSPEDYLFENNSRVRDESTGDVNDLNSLYFGFSGGLKYNALEIGNLDLIPEISYRYSALPVVNSLDWNVSSINLGLAISGFDFSKEEKPLDPPTPKLIEPEIPKVKEQPKTITQEITLSNFNGDNLKNDNIYYNVNKNIYEEDYSLPPILYYKIDSSIPTEYDLNTSTNHYGMQIDLLKSIAQYLSKSNQKAQVLLSTSSDSTLLQKRKDYIEEKLTAENVSLDNIQFLYKINDPSSFRYQELKEESEKVEFVMNNNELINYKFKEIEKININEQIELIAEINSNDKIYEKGIAKFSNSKIEISNKEKIIISPKDLLQIYNSNSSLVIEAKTPPNTKKQLSKIFKFSEKVNETRFVNYNETSNESQYILGYFDFDKSTFSTLDNEIKSKVNEALQQGKNVTFYSSTDNLGDSNYNQNLSKQRLKTALDVFSNSKNISTKISNEPFFENQHPFGRTMNRSIVVRIEN